MERPSEETGPEIEVVAANEALWEDLAAVFGERGDPSGCQCQWFKFPRSEWKALDRGAREGLLRAQTECGTPGAEATSGLVAYRDGEPVGWAAVEPRTEYPRLAGMKVPWAGREEDKEDPGVWAVTCFVTRKGYRRQGVSRALTAAAVRFARERGARAVEGYPMLVEPGKEYTWGELFVGVRDVFADAGFREVSHPFPRRVVMRIDFE